MPPGKVIISSLGIFKKFTRRIVVPDETAEKLPNRGRSSLIGCICTDGRVGSNQGGKGEFLVNRICFDEVRPLDCVIGVNCKIMSV